MMRAPASGFFAPCCVRSAIRPGISCSARRISLRPNSACDEVLHLERFAAGGLRGGERMRSSRLLLPCLSLLSLQCAGPRHRTSLRRCRSRLRCLRCAAVRFLRGCHEQPRTLRPRIRAAAGRSRSRSNPASLSSRCDLLFARSRARRGPSAAGSSRDRAAACRRRAARPPGLRTRATSASARSGLRHVVQHQHQRRRVEPRVVDRQRLELAAAQVDVVEAAAGASRAACSIAAEASTAITRATNGASAALTWPGAAAEVADDPRRRRASAGERREVEAIAEQLVAQPIPLAGRRGEELLRLRCGARRAPPAGGAGPARPPASTPTCSRTSSHSRRAAGSSSSRVIV